MKSKPTRPVLSQVRAVLFDAVGTLLRAVPSVVSAYTAAAHDAGISISEAEVKQRLALAMQRDRSVGYAIDSLPAFLELPATSEPSEFARWQRIVAEVFELSIGQSEPLFRNLWQHFAEAKHWQLMPGAERLLEALLAQRQQGRLSALAIASNFDARLRPLCAALAPLAQFDALLISSELGYPKPDHRFFSEAEKRLKHASSEMLLVGDDFYCDVVGGLLAGYQVVWIAEEDPRVAERIASLPSGLHERLHVASDLSDVYDLLMLP